MIPLGPVLVRLGLDQYLDAFVGEGFDSWETVLDITESDLDALNVKLGHRRKLQREIANFRGIDYDRSLGPPQESTGESGTTAESESQSTSANQERRSAGGNDGKRKYRRHPKPDENAPERPPSAYVIFSNRIREDVKSQNLSFTEIAKLVGESWQHLEPSEREPYEGQAAAAKDRYNAELATYKKTPEYRAYLEYLADFKAKHGPGNADGKRPRLDKEASTASSGSVGSTRQIGFDAGGTVSTHSRTQSFGSTSHSATLPSPGSVMASTAVPARLMPATSASPANESTAQLRGGSIAGSSTSTPMPFKVSSSPDETPGIVPSYIDVRPHHGRSPLDDERRPRATRMPPSLVHQDTSTSSHSSGSYRSESSTPGFKVQGKSEDPRPSRQLNASTPLPAMEAPSHNASSYAPGFSGPLSGPHPGHSTYRDRETDPSPSPNLLIEPRWNDPSRILPPPRVSPIVRDPHPLSASHSERPSPYHHRPAPSDHEKTAIGNAANFTDSSDPLAVLAYAGDIVNREHTK